MHWALSGFCLSGVPVGASPRYRLVLVFLEVRPWCLTHKPIYVGIIRAPSLKQPTRFSGQIHLLVWHHIARLSAIERIAEHASNFTVNLVGNAGDKVHQTSHFDPLREAAGELSTILLHETTVDWGSGHRSPTNNEYEEAVAAIYRDLSR